MDAGDMDAEATPMDSSIAESTQKIPPAPPSPLFDSFDELWDFLQGFYRNNGAALVKKAHGPERSINGGKRMITTRRLACDRGGVMKISAGRGLRNKPSKKTGCTFRILAKTNNGLNGKWVYVVLRGEHNHPPSQDPSEHVMHRRRTPQQLAIAASLVKHKGINAREMQQILEDSSPTPTYYRPKDIYNVRQAALRAQKEQETQSKH